jgi:hypothetical protein
MSYHLPKHFFGLEDTPLVSQIRVDACREETFQTFQSAVHSNRTIHEEEKVPETLHNLHNPTHRGWDKHRLVSTWCNENRLFSSSPKAEKKPPIPEKNQSAKEIK